MIGFDQDKVREILDIPSSHEIVLMISVGKEKDASRRLRGYRKPAGEFVTYIIWMSRCYTAKVIIK